jgi:hypothetical protein
MKVVFEGQSNLSADQEGEYYFYHGDTTWYLNDFMAVRNPKDNFGYQAATHISNTGGILINVDELEETVDYAIVTIEP